MACAGHLSASEWAACQVARARSGRLAAERREQEAAERDRLGVPLPATGGMPPDRPCIGKCLSKNKARGDDNDGALTECAHCDGFVCLNCGVKRVDNDFGWCDACDRLQPDDADYEPVTPLGNETYDGLFPQRRLTSAVARIVAATGRSYGSVNWAINQQSGVKSRVGAQEYVIRRAAWVAQYWLQQLDEASSPSDLVPASGTPTEPTSPKAYTVEEKRKAHPNAYALWLAEDDQCLAERCAQGASLADLSQEFGRNKGGVASRLIKINADGPAVEEAREYGGDDPGAAL